MLSEKTMDGIYSNIQAIVCDDHHSICLQHWFSYIACIRNRYTGTLGMVSEEQARMINCFIWWGFRRVW